MKFPDTALETTVEAYPMLNKAKLKTELSLNSEFKAYNGAVPLYQFMENNLHSTFTETVSLLKILITTPMTTAKSERCLYSEEDQDLPEKHHDTGSPECTGYALHGEETY
ncbi:unnamed protein product [Merluccius merluccius]